MHKTGLSERIMQIQCAGSSLGHMRKRSDLSFDELSWLKLSKTVSVSHVCLLSDMLAYMIHISIISPCNMHAVCISLSYVYIYICVCAFLYVFSVCNAFQSGMVSRRRSGSQASAVTPGAKLSVRPRSIGRKPGLWHIPNFYVESI